MGARKILVFLSFAAIYLKIKQIYNKQKSTFVSIVNNFPATLLKFDWNYNWDFQEHNHWLLCLLLDNVVDRFHDTDLPVIGSSVIEICFPRSFVQFGLTNQTLLDLHTSLSIL